jgi:tetratricopeptide (TPR) repeat protein
VVEAGREAVSKLDHAHLLHAYGRLLDQSGEPQAAMEAFQRVAGMLEGAGDEGNRAAVLGAMADILFRRGELDEAERIYREEELPVYEKVADLRERAVAWGNIADILFRRGELDEAERIYREEELPVYEKVGDLRSLLVGRVMLAQYLLLRSREGGRAEARELLCWSLAAARRMGLPEAGQIEAILGQVGLECPPGA